MALTEAFNEAVKSGNVRRVRIMMKNSLIVDPTFAEFGAMERAASSMTGLYEPYDGREMIEDKSQWNDDYMDKVMVKLVSNFSHERITHAKAVVRYLRPAAAKHTPPKNPSGGTQQRPRVTRSECTQTDPREKKQQDPQSEKYLGRTIGTGAAIGAFAGAAVAVIVGGSAAAVVGGIAAGAAVGGVVTAAVTGGGK